MVAKLFTPAVEARMAAEYVAGRAAPYLEYKYHCTRNTVYRVLRRQGVPVRSDPREQPHRNCCTPEEDARLRVAYEAGASLDMLRDRTGRSRRIIVQCIRRAGGRMRTELAYRSLTDDQEAEMRHRYEAGEAFPRIARQMGLGVNLVYNALRRQRTQMREYTRICQVDEAAFDDVSANFVGQYLVGLIMADGCVTYRRHVGKGYALALTLAGADGPHVGLLRDYLKSTHKLRVYTPLNKDGLPRSPVHALAVGSRRLVMALRQYGIVPRKSLTARVRLHADKAALWCGMVCGDGWVTFNQRGRPIVGLCGSRACIRQFIEFAKAIFPTRRRPYPTSSIFRVEFGGWRAVRLIRELFADCPFALPRKKAIADEILARFGDLAPRVPPWRRFTGEQVMELYRSLGSWSKVASLIGTTSKGIGRVRRCLGLA